MSHAVDLDATFETYSHSAEWTARFTDYRTAKCVYAGVRYRRGDSGALVDRHCDFIYRECDQCSVIVRDGE